MSSRAWLIGALLLLQASDVVLNWRLLTTRPDVIEANPVALRVLESYSWAGAVALKAASTAVALACVAVISRRRPAVGQALLGGLSAIMLVVVGYSAVLLARPAEVAPEAARQRAAEIDEQLAVRAGLVRVRDEAISQMLDGQLSLSDAVVTVAGHLRGNLSVLGRKSQAVWPSPDRPEDVARYLVVHCGHAARNASHTAALRGVREQFDRHYPRTRTANIGPLTLRRVSEAVAAHTQ